eukprot:COSAG02_NODE_36_length_48934_cov_144.851029_10_plen_245_part_00
MEPTSSGLATSPTWPVSCAIPTQWQWHTSPDCSGAQPNHKDPRARASCRACIMRHTDERQFQTHPPVARRLPGSLAPNLTEQRSAPNFATPRYASRPTSSCSRGRLNYCGSYTTAAPSTRPPACTPPTEAVQPPQALLATRRCPAAPGHTISVTISGTLVRSDCRLSSTSHFRSHIFSFSYRRLSGQGTECKSCCMHGGRWPDGVFKVGVREQKKDGNVCNVVVHCKKYTNHNNPEVGAALVRI